MLTVKVKTTNGREVAIEGVDGKVQGLALTPAIADPKAWAVTHIATGMAFFNRVDDRRTAELLLAIVGAVADWTKVTTNDEAIGVFRKLPEKIQKWIRLGQRTWDTDAPIAAAPAKKKS